MKAEALRALVEAAGVRPSRASGQNFLVDENLALAIARDGTSDDAPLVRPDGAQGGAHEAAAREDVVLELGTGPGVLTELLLPRAHHVLTVELDARLAALSRERLGAADNLTLLEADALANKNQLNPRVLEALAPLLAGGRRLRVVANLPYAVATPLVVGLLAAPLPLSLMVVMVQLEAAERFAAGVGHPQYGAVSVLCASLCARIKLLRKVPPDVFWPRPKVHSAVVRFEPRPGRQAGFEALSSVVRALFNYRRKTVSRAAREVARREPHLAWIAEAVARLDEEGVLEPRARPEDLDVIGFSRVAALAPQ